MNYGNVTSSIRNIPSTELLTTNFPTYCNIGPTPAVYFNILFEGQVRLRQFLGRALRLGRQGAERRNQNRLGGRALLPQVHITLQYHVLCRSDVQYSGFGVGQKWSMADMCRSKNTPPLVIASRFSALLISRLYDISKRGYVINKNWVW